MPWGTWIKKTGVQKKPHPRGYGSLPQLPSLHPPLNRDLSVLPGHTWPTRVGEYGESDMLGDMTDQEFVAALKAVFGYEPFQAVDVLARVKREALPIKVRHKLMMSDGPGACRSLGILLKGLERDGLAQLHQNGKHGNLWQLIPSLL